MRVCCVRVRCVDTGCVRACVRAWNAAWYDGAYLQVPVAHAVVVHILYSGDDLIHYVTCVLLRVLALVNDLERGEREEERRREEERERGRGGEGEGAGREGEGERERETRREYLVKQFSSFYPINR